MNARWKGESTFSQKAHIPHPPTQAHMHILMCIEIGNNMHEEERTECVVFVRLRTRDSYSCPRQRSLRVRCLERQESFVTAST